MNKQSEVITAQLDLSPAIQTRKLVKGLDPSMVSKKQGFSYIEGCQAIASANEIFGFGGWSTFFDIIKSTTISVDKGGKPGFKTAVVMKVKVVVSMANKQSAVHEDIGLGFATSYKDELETYDSAYKEAKTDGIKRCLRHMGNQFGNSLYFKGNPVHDGNPDSEGWDEERFMRLEKELTEASDKKSAFESRLDIINGCGGKTKDELRKLYKTLT
jgi:DNA repair and recombination protein RAD52